MVSHQHPLNVTPTFTHSRTHTPTHTSCVYTDTHTDAHKAWAQPKQRSSATSTPTSPRWASSSHPLNREGNQPRSEAMRDRQRGGGGAERGQEMEGKKDSVRHSVSQSSRAVGKLDTVPGGGKRPFMPCKMWGSQNQDPSRLGSEAGDAVPSWATSLGQPLNRGEW